MLRARFFWKPPGTAVTPIKNSKLPIEAIFYASLQQLWVQIYASLFTLARTSNSKLHKFYKSLPKLWIRYLGTTMFAHNEFSEVN